MELSEGILTATGDEERLQCQPTPTPRANRAHCVTSHLACLSARHILCPHLSRSSRDFNVFFLTLSVRMQFMLRGLQDLWAREAPLPLPSSPLFLSGLSLQQVAGHPSYHGRTGKPHLRTKVKETRVEDYQGSGTQKYGTTWQICCMFLRFVRF